MHTRRQLLSLLLAGLAPVGAGCSALADEPSTTATVTRTAMPTATPETTTAADDDEPVIGWMAVVVDGERIDLAEALDGADGFRMTGAHPDSWRAPAPLTLAEALSTFGVEADASTLTYDGTTVDGSRSGATLSYRVDGEEVDPTVRDLTGDEKVWVVALTPESPVETPGDYIRSHRLHIHGSMEFVVDGEALDFSDEKWQAADHSSHFHFEGGNAVPWHAHSWSVTLANALSTLSDIEVTEEGITYADTTYDGDDVSVTADGEAVDPRSYFLRDGAAVRIELA